jgi:hypothetical protein
LQIFISADWNSRHRKKIILYYRKQQLKRYCDKQLVHITVIIRSKNIFSSLESFQTLQLLNTHLVNFKFILRNYLLTVFAIYFVDRKYEVNSCSSLWNYSRSRNMIVPSWHQQYNWTNTINWLNVYNHNKVY